MTVADLKKLLENTPGHFTVLGEAGCVGFEGINIYTDHEEVVLE
jgi:hypothetical protein